MFEGRTIIVATKHEKEKVIAPILETELGVKCILSKELNTDEFGTFTGEVERKDDPITVARNKCLRAMELTNCDLAVSSEGSFGAHPTILFAPADDEILFFMDKRNQLEIVARKLSIDTNFKISEIISEKELIEFANVAQFPSHGLILRKQNQNNIEIKKGITDVEILLETYNQFSKTDGVIYVETDMRAVYNPTRMKVIEQVTQKLVNKIHSTCPSCHTPGFGITNVKDGLPCESCNLPTRSTLSYIYICQKCNFSKEEKYPTGKSYENPMYCDICNP